jgi:hypothetical protein
MLTIRRDLLEPGDLLPWMTNETRNLALDNAAQLDFVRWAVVVLG